MSSSMEETPDDNSPQRSVWLKWGLITYWIGVFLLTHLPFPDTGASFPHADKVVHMGIYTGLAFLLSALMTIDSWQASWKIFLVCICYAMLDELLQIPIPTRAGDWRDWIADVIGTTVGLAAWLVFKRRWQNDSH